MKCSDCGEIRKLQVAVMHLVLDFSSPFVVGLFRTINGKKLANHTLKRFLILNFSSPLELYNFFQLVNDHANDDYLESKAITSAAPLSLSRTNCTFRLPLVLNRSLCSSNMQNSKALPPNLRCSRSQRTKCSNRAQTTPNIGLLRPNLFIHIYWARNEICGFTSCRSKYDIYVRQELRFTFSSAGRHIST